MRGDEMAPFTSWIFAQPPATLVLQHKLLSRRHVTSKIRNVKLWVYLLTAGQWSRSNISSDHTASVQEPSKPAEKNLINLLTNISNNLCSIFQSLMFSPGPFIFLDLERDRGRPFMSLQSKRSRPTSYRSSLDNYSIQLDDIAMFELSHCSCFSKEFWAVLWRVVVLEHLHGSLHSAHCSVLAKEEKSAKILSVPWNLRVLL